MKVEISKITKQRYNWMDKVNFYFKTGKTDDKE